MKPHLTVITLGVADLERSLTFYRDGLGLPTQGIVGQEFEHGAAAFFKLDGFDDSLLLAKRLVAEAGIGLAPGNAFAPEAQGWLRWCFASKDVARLRQGVDRLAGWLAR